MAMTLQQAAAAFRGPRTYKAPDGSIRRTTAWETFLRRNGLGHVLTSGGGIGTVPAGTPPPVGMAPVSIQPESHADPINTGTPGSGIGGPPVAPPPPPPPPRPTLDQFGTYQDADYFLGLNDLRAQLGLVQNPDGSMVSQAAQARLAQLGQRVDPTTFKPVTDGVGGKTLYDILYAQQQQQDARNVSMSRTEAARKGVLRSGWMDRTLAGVAGQSAAAVDQLVRNYGTDLNDSRSAAFQTSQQQANALTQYQQAQANLAAAATQRGYQNALSQYQQTYGGY